jgi:hypothetical protein
MYYQGKNSNGSAWAFASRKAACGAVGSHHQRKEQGKKTPPRERRECTVVIHRLFEAHVVGLLQHLSVNVDYVYACLIVSVSFARVVKDPQCDVPCHTRDVDAADMSL